MLITAQSTHSRFSAPSPPPLAQKQAEPSDEVLIDFDAASTKKRDSGWKNLGKALLFGAAASSSFLASPASAEVVAETVVEASKIQRAMTESQFAETVDSLPADFFDLMQGLSDAQIKVLGGGINGKTKVSVVTVDNRKAFIKGKAYGRDVWPYVHDSVGRISVRDGLNEEDTQELHQAVDQMQHLSRTQRRGLAEIMDAIIAY